MGSYGTKARHAKSKARLQAYDKMLNEDVKQKEDKLEIYIPNGPRLGDKVIQMQGVSKSYGEKVLIQDLTFSLPPAGILLELLVLMVPVKLHYSA
ncbi:MAG: hypothetical protein MZV49_11390 [Rhodopseudomonas palustris]|nr:hypothetical protein [Rhodopseudomonas palustris]